MSDQKTPEQILADIKAGEEFSNESICITYGKYGAPAISENNEKVLVLNERDGCSRITDSEALTIITQNL